MFNTSNIGKTVALIISEDKKKQKYNNLTICLNEDYDKEDDLDKNSYDYIHLKYCKFIYAFNPKDGFRISWYIAGANGSGKSYALAEFIKHSFYRYFPKDYPIYLFTEKEQEEAFEGITMKRIKIDQSLVDEPFDFNDFKDALVIMDDVDAITGAIGKSLVELRNKLLKNGRSNRTSVIITNHDLCDGKYTKSLLNECDVITFFLRTYNKSTKYFVENYIGISKDGVDKLRNNKSRATTYVKSYPNIIIQEHDIYTINKLNEKV